MVPELHSSLRPYRTHAVLRAAAAALGTLGGFWAVALVVAVVWTSQPGAPLSAALTVAGLGIAGLVAALVVGTVVALRALRAPHSLAAHVEDMLPELGDSVRAAVGLAHEHTPSGMSAALRRAHLHATTLRLADPDLRSRHLRATVRESRPFLATGTSGLLVMGVLYALAPDRLAAGVHRAFTLPFAAPERAEALPPLWSDVTMVLNYPAYMGRAPLTLEGVSGDITAPRGTEVRLTANADRTVKAARLIFGSAEVALLVSGGRQLEGTFILKDTGRYRLALTPPDGDDVVEDQGHQVTVEPDNAPQVELLDPGEDKTVLSTDKVALNYRGQDDYGLTEFTLVIRNLRKGGEPERRVLLRPRDEKEASGRATLDIATLKARPGDRLIVAVEAKDNDTISGPKAGLSPNRTLKVFSAAEHHNELIAKQEELLNRMVVQLADELETPLDPPAAGESRAPDAEAERWQAQVKRGQDVNAALGKLADAFHKDELAPPEVARALRNIRDDLSRTYDEMSVLATELVTQVRVSMRFPEPYAQRSRRLGRTAVGKLEKHIIYMEDLVGKQRLMEAKEAAKDLAATQERLRELLKEYKQAGDEETRKRILEEMAALREQIKELNAKLAQLQRDIPQEYVNMDALQSQDLQDPLSEIDRMLAEGDIEGAARALEKMAESTQKLMDEMQKGEQEYGGEDYKELQEQLLAFKEELDDVTRQQEGLLNESRSRLERARERARKQLGEDPEQFAQKVQKEAEELLEQLKKIGPQGLLDLESEQRAEAEARVDETVRALKARDFEEAQRAIRQAEGTLEWMRSSLADRTEGPFATNNRDTKKAREKLDGAMPKARHIAEQLDKLMPDPAAHMTAEERQAMQEAARRQGRLGERARRLAQQMSDIGEKVPVFDPSHKESLEGARREMQNAQGDLQSQDLPGATGRQREALGRMQQLQKQLAQMGQQGGGQGGMPLPFGQGGSGRGEGGGSGMDHEKVEIPNADAFKVPPQFRKDILDAMKEAPPNRFEGEVKQYYEELVK